jgi:hypothetical protein
MIFIVGNSRSGTTMLSRMLNNHSRIFCLKETHFYNRWIKNKNSNTTVNQKKAIEILASLVSMQEEDYQQINLKTEYLNFSKKLISNYSSITYLDIFKTLSNHYTKLHKKSITAEKTPQHIMHLDQIFFDFSDAKVIHLYRDPRSILLSQKNKIYRDKIGGKSMPFDEKMRLFFNYNPIFHSLIWNSSILHGKNKKLYQLCYEKLIIDSEAELIRLCTFLGIEFEESMLKIPHKGSSIFPDNNIQIGLHTKSLNNWTNQLSKSEIFICQLCCNKFMSELEYSKTKISIIYSIPAILWLLILPFQTIIVFVLNFKKIGKISYYLKNRFSVS